MCLAKLGVLRPRPVDPPLSYGEHCDDAGAGQAHGSGGLLCGAAADDRGEVVAEAPAVDPRDVDRLASEVLEQERLDATLPSAAASPLRRLLIKTTRR